MNLAEYIESNLDRLVAEWESFARTVEPPALTMSQADLKNWATQLLLAVAAEMRTQQTSTEQKRKSKGMSPRHAPALTEHSRIHAVERLHQGFSLNQLVSEYRALRASVVRLWTSEHTDAPDALSQLIRFDEAIDQSLTESVHQYSTRLERARDLFVGTLGHDLYSPLSAISYSADLLLLRENGMPSEDVRAVVRIINGVDRMQRMLEDLLDFTRTRLGGELPLHREPLDLGVACDRVLEEFEPQLGERLLRSASGDLEGYWDRTRIEQVISNLVSNAIEHGDEDGAVKVELLGQADDVELRVENEGEPLPWETQQVMYDPLVRGEILDDHRHRNLGLGLFITKQIVDAHGGAIELVSNETHGTAFRITLPRQPPASPA